MFQCGQGGSAVGRSFRVGYGEVAEIALAQQVRAVLHQARSRRPQDQAANGIGEAATGYGRAFLLEPPWRGVIR